MTANGQLAASELVAVQSFTTKYPVVTQLTGNTIYLATAAAAQWKAMVAAARAAGLVLQAINPAGGYRSLAVQQSMHSNPTYWNLDPKVTIAAVGSSTHGLGMNVDIAGYTGQASLRAWVDAHAKDFGFIHRDLAGDPACMKFTGTVTAGGGSTPIPNSAKDASMPISFGRASNSTWFTMEPRKTLTKLLDVNDANLQALVTGHPGLATELPGLNDAQVMRVLTLNGFGEFVANEKSLAALDAMTAHQVLYTTEYKADLANATVNAATVDLKPLEDLIAALPAAVVKAEGDALSNG